jgi:hypothetical protein
VGREKGEEWGEIAAMAGAKPARGTGGNAVPRGFCPLVSIGRRAFAVLPDLAIAPRPKLGHYLEIIINVWGICPGNPVGGSAMASWHLGLRRLCFLAAEFAVATAFIMCVAAIAKYGL